MVKHFFQVFSLGWLVSANFFVLHGATGGAPATPPGIDNVRSVGDVNCQSSMCHGGASPSRNQFTIWSRDDAHSRSYATLATGWSAMIAKNLTLKVAPGQAENCTTCHAPFASLEPGSQAEVTEGVSCEKCHGGAENWLRGHTRYDWTYADRVHAGMRDLRDAYTRANTCVACHQVIDPALVKAGHPELTFELDGQTASEPRHWMEKPDWYGPKAWLVGQAVALREMSLSLARSENKDADLARQQQALYWLLQQANVFMKDPNAPNPEATAVAAWSNQVAQAFSAKEWKTEFSSNVLAALVSTSSGFTDESVPIAERELRAERLVLGLDRLFKSLHPKPNAPGQVELAALFAAVPDRKQFDAEKFSSALQKFADVVTPKK